MIFYIFPSPYNEESHVNHEFCQVMNFSTNPIHFKFHKLIFSVTPARSLDWIYFFPFIEEKKKIYKKPRLFMITHSGIQIQGDYHLYSRELWFRKAIAVNKPRVVRTRNHQNFHSSLD